MKKMLFTLLMVFSAIAGMSQTIGEAFYVYRNDGMINTFFRGEIDSMAYSYYDIDSTRYDEVVTQVIYTQDSIYRLPLALVDSVGFVTPNTKYQLEVVILEGTIRDYIIGSDSLSVFFRHDTPLDILPKIGDKLVTTEMSEVFMGGFLGQVEEKEQKGDTIAIHCSAIGIEEVYEYFYYTTDGESQNCSNKVKAIGWNWSGYYTPGPFAFSFASFLNANIKPIDCPINFLKLPPKLDITIAPTFRSKGSIIVHPLRGVVISVDTKQHTSFSEDFAVTGSIGKSQDFAPDIIPMYPILPFVSIYGEMGFFLKANMNLSLEGHWNQSLDYDIHYEASYLPVMPMPISTTIPKFTINNVNLTTEHKGEFMIDGSVSGGIYGEIGIVPLYSKHIAKAGFRFEAGIKIGGDVMLYNSDGENSLISTTTYERLKAGELYVKPFCNVGLQAKLLDVGKVDVNLFKKEWDLGRFKLVPDFENTTLTRDEDIPSTLWAATIASGSTVVPSTLGFKLFEGKDQKGVKGLDSHSYWNPFGYSEPFFEIFEKKSLVKSYAVYPTVNLFGIEMLAEPSAEVELGATPITLEASDISDTSAKVWGKIEGHELLDETAKFGLGYYEVGSSGSTLYDASSINADGIFSVEFKALKPKTKYKYFAYLIIDGETYYGDNKEFTTKEEEKREPYYVWDEKDSIVTFYYDGNRKSRKGKLLKDDMIIDYEAYSLKKAIFDSSFSRCYPKSFTFGCRQRLQSIDNIEYLNTDSITDMSGMFYLCSSLTSLDLSSFNTSNVKYMNGMFSCCYSLISLDVSNFNTSNVTRMYDMFSNCTSLKNLDLSSFNTSNVTNMRCMFENCKSLTSLNLSSFNTSNVTEMTHMFENCESLSNLDLGSFNTSNVTSMRFMFDGCSSLKRIYAGNWNVARYSDSMFRGCKNLVGRMGTKIGRNLYGHDEKGNPLYYNCPDDGQAAHIDGGKDNPGLF